MLVDGGERVEVRDLVAALDQANAALSDVARVLGDYRSELVAAGFDREEALELCIDVQRAIMFDGERG